MSAAAAGGYLPCRVLSCQHLNVDIENTTDVRFCNQKEEIWIHVRGVCG